MERIVLEVDDKIAQAWRSYPSEKRERIERQIEARIAENIRKEKKGEFLQHLDDIQKKAAANGLTQEILEQLLNEETKFFVFDVNTFVSAFLVGSHTNTLAFRKALDIGYVISTQLIIEELTDVFVRKKFDRYLVLDERIKTLSYLDKQVIKWPLPVEIIAACRDPRDNKYLELAVAANASAIVTGDKDLLVLHPFQDIPIVSPADFLLLF